MSHPNRLEIGTGSGRRACMRAVTCALFSLLTGACRTAAPPARATVLQLDPVSTHETHANASEPVAPLSSTARVIIPAPPLAAPPAASSANVAATESSTEEPASDASRSEATGETSQASEATSEATNKATSQAPAPFTPTDSPLLAYYDAVPHGKAPPAELDPLFAPRVTDRGYRIRYSPSYGYRPYYGGYGYDYGYGYPAYGYGGYGYGGYGYGRVYPGIAFGWPFALRGSHGYGGYRSGYGHSHGFGGNAWRGGGRHFGGGGYRGRR